MTSDPGTWRIADESKVDWPTATRAWADAALPVLHDAATQFGSIVRYGDLGEAVQAVSGIRTRSLLTNWIGDVLRAVTDRPYAPGEPMWSAMVVNAAGHVGPGYAEAVKSREGIRPADPDLHAAEERLRCHRYIGANVPDDAQPQLPPDLARRRDEDAAKARAQAPRPKCPSCGGWKALGVKLCDDCTP